VLASDLAPQGVRVDIVIPGPTRTRIRSSRFPTAEALAAVEENITFSIPLSDLAEAEDTANAVLFLGSDEARSITAAEIAVDGGTSGAPGGAPIYRSSSRRRIPVFGVPMASRHRSLRRLELLG
jgi:NAD(P)-dependent dehydrogenase (short-subunit alcohol dehydrogenase family)